MLSEPLEPSRPSLPIQGHLHSEMGKLGSDSPTVPDRGHPRQAHESQLRRASGRLSGCALVLSLLALPQPPATVLALVSLADSPQDSGSLYLLQPSPPSGHAAGGRSGTRECRQVTAVTWLPVATTGPCWVCLSWGSSQGHGVSVMTPPPPDRH